MTDSDLSAQQRFTASLPGRLEAIETGVRGCATEPESESLQDAILAAYDYLRDHPSAKKSDFLEDVYPDHKAGFSTAEGWWNVVQPALKKLPQVDPPKERGHIWHFLGG